MKKAFLTFFLSLTLGSVFAQTDDPILMHINGHPITRSEYEYSYNKNNSNGVIDKKSVADYLPLFIAYKLKVEAAQDAKLDTTALFKREFAMYRDQQIRPSVITDQDVEDAAYKIYKETQERVDSMGGLVKAAHILILEPRNATEAQKKEAKNRADSLYKVLKKGGDFKALAKKYSQDPGSAQNGGELPYLTKDRLVKEFADVAWALKKGEFSKPVKTQYGWHIILKEDARNYYDYATVHNDIISFINNRGLRDQIIDQKLNSIAKADGTTPAKVLEAKRIAMEKKSPVLRYLIQEYHDGILLYDIANRMVWDKAQKDSIGLEAYFKKHAKKYKWAEPRFKGVAYCARYQDDIDRVKEAVKGQPFTKWTEILRSTFNKDSVMRIRAEKGIFKEGMNALVDKEIFGKDTVNAPIKNYPYTAVYGRKINAPEEADDVRAEVIADYQDELEKNWVEALRKRYKVSVDDKVLATVNKH